MKLTSGTDLPAYLMVTEVRNFGTDDALVDGRLVIAASGYSLRFSFRDMSITTRLGSRGIGEVRLDNGPTNETTASFVSGLIIQMVVADPQLREAVHPLKRKSDEPQG